MQTEAIYGAAPIDLGPIDISPVEMMFWLYCPVKLAGSLEIVTPPNLAGFAPIVDAVKADCSDRWLESNVYLTAKTLHVTPENRGNRPGWHSDGFLTDDLNYIWSDTNPTLFWVSDKLVSFSADHLASMAEMDLVAEADRENHCVFPNRHLLRLDQAVIHRVSDFKEPAIRTFVKVSVSKHEYRLSGNSVNHALKTGWTYESRSENRNAPEVLSALTASASEPAPCRHEPYQGRCVHCNVPFVDGRPYLAPVPASEPEPVANTAPFEFDRFIGGTLMAEGVTIENATTLEQACIKAARLASRGKDGQVPVLVFRPRAANPVPTPDGAVEALATIKQWHDWAFKWSGTAFIAGETLPRDGMTEAEHKAELYSDLCKLGNHMGWLHEKVTALSAALEAPWQKPGRAAQAQAGDKPDFPADEQSGETSHGATADGWRDIESAPTGWGNFFFVRPCGMHHSGKPYLPTIVQSVDGEFYTPENELDPVYFGQNEPEDSPLKSTLEWFPIPQGWITAAPAAKPEGE